MKRSKFLIICICFYIAFFLICKMILLFNIDLFSNNQSIEYNKVSTISINKNSDIDNYFKSESTDIMMENIFTDFELADSSSDLEYYIGNNGDSSLYIAKAKSLLTQLESKNKDSIYYELSHFPMYISDNLKNYIIEKNNIKNDRDLIRQVIKERKTPNIFTPIIKIKEDYLYEFVENMTYLSSNIIFIEGDYTGYIVTEDNDYYIVLNYGNDNYYITLHNIENITIDDVIDLISTIKK